MRIYISLAIFESYYIVHVNVKFETLLNKKLYCALSHLHFGPRPHFPLFFLISSHFSIIFPYFSLYSFISLIFQYFSIFSFIFPIFLYFPYFSVIFHILIYFSLFFSIFPYFSLFFLRFL